MCLLLEGLQKLKRSVRHKTLLNMINDKCIVIENSSMQFLKTSFLFYDVLIVLENAIQRLLNLYKASF